MIPLRNVLTYFTKNNESYVAQLPQLFIHNIMYIDDAHYKTNYILLVKLFKYRVTSKNLILDKIPHLTVLNVCYYFIYLF